MGHPEPLNPAGGDSYRLEKHASFLIWALLAVAGAVGMMFPPGAFVLLPFAFLFVKLNPYRFLVLWFASSLFFLETYRSVIHFLSASDSLVFVYAALLALFALPAGLKLRVPLNVPFFCLYLLIALTLVFTPGALARYPTLGVVYDVKIMFLLGFIAVLVSLEGPARQPKKVFLLLGTVILFSTLHALEMIASFLVSGGARPTTWTAIFIASSILFCVILLRLPFSPRMRRLLWTALVICALGVVVIQTRSIWLSTAFCLGWLFLDNLLRMRGRRLFGYLLRLGLGVVLTAIVLNVAFLAAMGKSFTGFVTDRFADVEWIGLLDPYSSTGYRLHESWAVWDERTFWGHGPGATLNLFFTQLNKSAFMDWWAIHSGYFELLHKTGFAGLFLWAGMGLALFWMAWRLTRRGKRWEAAAGLCVMMMLVNHAISSISANEFNRANSPVMWFLAFYITYTLGAEPAARRFKRRLATGGTPRREPPAG